MAAKLKDSDLSELVDKHAMLSRTLFELRATLTSDNYEEWSEAFAANMRAVHLFQFISGDWSESTMQNPSWRTLDQLAKDNVIMNISSSMKNFVRGEATAKAIYDKLVLNCEGNAVMRSWGLCKQIKDLMSDGSEKLDEIAMNYTRVVDNLRALFRVPKLRTTQKIER